MTKQTFCLVAADIHGNITQYAELENIVRTEKISFVFLCGDLLPKTGGSWTPENKIRTIKMQADFIRNYFLSYLRELGKSARVYAIFGNDDFKSNYEMVAGSKIPGVIFLNNEIAKIPNSDFFVAGYPNIGITPFLHKDWEKWDVVPNDIPHKIYRTDGYISENGRHLATDLLENPATISDDLASLAKLSNPRKTLYIFHEAPFGTPLDKISPDNKYIKNGNLHVGSVAIRQFIEKFQPLITMHGHIHETFRESGDYKWKSGKSLAVAPANDFSSDILSYVIFSLKEPTKSNRREVLAKKRETRAQL
jgi:Icc-related predicted phosphoesterase